jgi:NTP pyrophosphatase (non-canonical NTP hydrolase)
MDMTLRHLCNMNAVRNEQWPGMDGVDEMFFTAAEVAEEGGEVLGAAKKLVRHDQGIAGNSEADRDALVRKLEDEIADVFINVSRLCNVLGVDPDEVVRRKFNRTSRARGIPVYL